MTPRFWLAATALGISALFGAAQPAAACSCIPTGSYPATVCQAYVQAQSVFAGQVLSITPHPTLAYHNNVRFAVSEGFKNQAAGTETTVVAPINSGICGVSFVAGNRYLFYGATICAPGNYTKPLANAANDLATLRSGVCASVPPAPTGFTAQPGTVTCTGTPAQPVVLRWNTVAGAISYSVKRYVSGTSWATIASGLTATTHSVAATSTATYAVSAVGAGGEGPRTNGVQGHVLVPPCASPTPTATVPSRPSPTATTPVRATPTSRPAGDGWQAGVLYRVGNVVSYGGRHYRCIQAHTSQAGWEPPNVPALWSMP
jgi:hypothetical protein